MKIPGGNEYEYRFIRPSQIKVDTSYQRELDQRRDAKIIKNFNANIFNEPKVSYRDGKYWVFDGQHSVAAWIAKFGDKPIYCKVYKGLTWLEEVELFLGQTGLSKQLTKNENLRPKFNANDPEVRMMVDCAERAGFLVDFKQGQARSRIVATGSLYDAYKMLGSVEFYDMLCVIRSAWGNDDSDAVAGIMLKGMAMFYKTYRGKFKSADLVKRLQKVSPATIIRNAKTYASRSTAKNYAREILKAYNVKRSSNRLDDIL